MLRGERAESLKKARDSRIRIESTLEEERRKHLRALENRHAKQLSEQRAHSEEAIQARLKELAGELSTDEDERNRIEHSLRTDRERQMKQLEAQLEGRRLDMIAQQRQQMLQMIQYQRDFVEAKLGLVVSSATRVAEKKNKLAAIVEAKSGGEFKSIVKRTALKRKREGAVLANNIAMKWRLKAKAKKLGGFYKSAGAAAGASAGSGTRKQGKFSPSNHARGQQAFAADSATAQVLEERLGVIEDLLKSIAAKQGAIDSAKAAPAKTDSAKADLSSDLLLRQRSTAIEKLLGNIATREQEAQSFLEEQKSEHGAGLENNDSQGSYAPELILDRLKGYAFAATPEVEGYIGEGSNKSHSDSFDTSKASFAQQQQRRREEIEQIKKSL